MKLEALRDVVWRILKEKGIDYKYVPATADDMPMPKPSYLVPFFDQVTWDQMMQAIAEAQEIFKAQVVKEARSQKEIAPTFE